MAENLVTAPSGLVVKVRNLKGKEANLFTNTKLNAGGRLIDEILLNVVTEVVDPGPYTAKEDGSLNWADVLTGDRYFLALQTRIATYGPKMEFNSRCESCSKPMAVSVDLTEDLDVTDLAEEARDKLAAGERFKTELTHGDTTVYWHLQTGRDEHWQTKNLERAQEDGRLVTISIRGRIDSIEGVHNNDLVKFIEDMHMEDQMDLLDSMEEYDCGVDGSFPNTCEYCAARQEVSVPLVGPDMWTPRRKKSKKRRRG